MSMLESLGFIMAILLVILTTYSMIRLIYGDKKRPEYDGMLIINDTPEKQFWDINVNTELDKLAKKKYIVLEVRYHKSSKYSNNTEFIKNWDPEEEDE